MEKLIKQYRQYLDSVIERENAMQKIINEDGSFGKLLLEEMELKGKLSNIEEQQEEYLEKKLPKKLMTNEEAEKLKQQILQEMKKKGEIYHGGLKAKVTEKKVVNQDKVLEAVGGDIEKFLSLSSITQKAIKDLGEFDLDSVLEIIEIEYKDLVIAQESAPKKISSKAEF